MPSQGFDCAARPPRADSGTGTTLDIQLGCWRPRGCSCYGVGMGTDAGTLAIVEALEELPAGRCTDAACCVTGGDACCSQVLYHPRHPHTLISGSVDGLLSVSDFSAGLDEDDAFQVSPEPHCSP